jgi:hypothetical protein
MAALAFPPFAMDRDGDDFAKAVSVNPASKTQLAVKLRPVFIRCKSTALSLPMILSEKEQIWVLVF